MINFQRRKTIDKTIVFIHTVKLLIYKDFPLNLSITELDDPEVNVATWY